MDMNEYPHLFFSSFLSLNRLITVLFFRKSDVMRVDLMFLGNFEKKNPVLTLANQSIHL